MHPENKKEVLIDKVNSKTGFCYPFNNKVVFIFLNILLGAVFVFSGFAKLDPIEPFEYTFVDLGFISWQAAPFVARLLIAFEFLIGVLLIFQYNLKKFTYKIGIAVLILFCLYLILLIALVGDKGNCGCFGDAIQMTPLQALIKNGIMLFLFFFLYIVHAGWKLNKKANIFFTCFIALTVIITPFILNPIALDYSEVYLNKPENNYKLELDSLYNYATLSVPPKTLSQGKQVIAFMSLTCSHCRYASKKMRIMHERNPEISFYFVLNGNIKNLQSFYEDTGTKDIPHCMLNGRNFVYLSGTTMPAIYLVNNSMVEFHVNYFDLNQEEIEKWMN